MKILIKIIRLSTLFFCFLSYFSHQGYATEKGFVRYNMGVILDSVDETMTYQSWLQQLPLQKSFLKKIESWFQDQGVLESKVEPFFYNPLESQVLWKNEMGEVVDRFTVVSIHPLVFRLNGVEKKIEYSQPTLDYIYRQLEGAYKARKVSFLWSLLLPIAEAKTKKSKSVLSRLMVPLIVVNGLGLAYAGKTIYDSYQKASEQEARFDGESKVISETRERVGKANLSPKLSYSVSSIDCRRSVDANPGENKNSVHMGSYRLKKIRLTPIGKRFGEDDLEILYYQVGGKTKIKEIWSRRTVGNQSNKAIRADDCLLYSELIKDPKYKFLVDCQEKVFTNKKMSALTDFYSALGDFKLKDYEAMAETEPGCNQIIDWAINGSNRGTNAGKKTSEPAKTTGSQNR